MKDYGLDFGLLDCRNRCGLVALGFLFCTTVAIAQAGSESGMLKDDPNDLVRQFILAVQLRQQGRSIEIEQRTEQLADRLVSQGARAIPAIKEALTTSTTRIRSGLVWVIGLIDGDEASRLLADLIMDPDPNVASFALNRLSGRAESIKGDIVFPLPNAVVDRLLAMIADYNDYRGIQAAWVLTKAKKNDVSDLVPMLLTRFRRAVLDKSLGTQRHFGSYVSPRVHHLNQYLLLFSHLRPNAVVQIKALRDSIEPNETHRWLTLALGMCGEGSVADEVRQIVEKDPDPYVRCVAIRAYARSAGQKAIPVLEGLLQDNFAGEYINDMTGEPYYPIRLVARDMLAVLRRSDNLSKEPVDPNSR